MHLRRRSSPPFPVCCCFAPLYDPRRIKYGRFSAMDRDLIEVTVRQLQRYYAEHR